MGSSRVDSRCNLSLYPSGGAVSRLSQTVEELKKDLPGAASRTVVPTPGKPESATIPANAAQGVPVQLVETSKASPMELAQSVIAPLLGPLGTGALVLLLVICMLLQREDLRSRLIRLIGQSRYVTLPARALSFRISGTGIRSIPNGLIPTNTRINPVQLPEPTLPFGRHVSETPNCLDIWHRGPVSGPKSPRSWTQDAVIDTPQVQQYLHF